MHRWLYLLLLSLFFVACGDAGRDGQGGLPVPSAPKRVQDSAQLAQGEQVYAKHCARCHGKKAQGASNWHKPGPDGLYPPPPLDGSGHAWHHSTQVLRNVIANGSPQGKGNMPAWKEKLSAAEMEAVIAWFQSRWPQPVYDAWYEMQQRTINP
jgi:mono/diheme cytochrome c family protein